MLIKIKNVKGGEKEVQVQLGALVVEVKAAIGEVFNVLVPQQKLLFKGRILDDQKSISEYNVKEGDTLILMITQAPAVPVEAPKPEPAIVQEPEVPENVEDESEPVSRGTFNFLIGNPEFESILQIIRNDPRAFEDFIVQLEVQNPELYDLINKHKREFIELIRGRDVETDQVQLTHQEFAEVKELMALGFSAQDSLDAYLSCGRHKETAANLLFNGFN